MPASRNLAPWALALAFGTLACGRGAESPGLGAGSAALSRETSTDRIADPQPGSRVDTSEPDPPDEKLEPGPAQTLWLAPPTEVLQPDPDLTARLTAAAFKRRDDRRLEIFTHASAVGAVWGTVVDATSEVFDSKEDPAGFTATRYQIKPQRSWKITFSDLVAVWVPGGQHAAVSGSDGPPPDNNYSGQAYFTVGQEVLLSLRAIPLFPGAEARLVVFGGSTGALVAVPESKTDGNTLDAFARTLDQRLPGF